MNVGRAFLLIATLLVLSACGQSPGEIAGTWRSVGVVPMTIQFRTGEYEMMGMAVKAKYEIHGNDVLVTDEVGPMKGVGVRYTLINHNTLHSAIGNLVRVN
jgi:hypothetical protein